MDGERLVAVSQPSASFLGAESVRKSLARGKVACFLLIVGGRGGGGSPNIFFGRLEAVDDTCKYIPKASHLNCPNSDMQCFTIRATIVDEYHLMAA